MALPETKKTHAVTPEGDQPKEKSHSSPRSLWRKWIVDPVISQLTQGITPKKISLTLAVGTACSLFPFIGFTSLLNLLAGIIGRMNHAIMQGVNYLLTPLHLALILVYVHLGEYLWNSHSPPFTVAELIRAAGELSLREFIHRFGLAGLHAFSGWFITSPLLIAALYIILRPIVDNVARRLPDAPLP